MSNYLLLNLEEIRKVEPILCAVLQELDCRIKVMFDELREMNSRLQKFETCLQTITSCQDAEVPGHLASAPGTIIPVQYDKQNSDKEVLLPHKEGPGKGLGPSKPLKAVWKLLKYADVEIELLESKWAMQ